MTCKNKGKTARAININVKMPEQRRKVISPKRLAFALVTLVMLASLMAECTPRARVQDLEYMDLKDLYDMIQQNDLRPKKARMEYVEPLKLRFGRRSDPGMMREPTADSGGSLD